MAKILGKTHKRYLLGADTHSLTLMHDTYTDWPRLDGRVGVCVMAFTFLCFLNLAYAIVLYTPVGSLSLRLAVWTFFWTKAFFVVDNCWEPCDLGVTQPDYRRLEIYFS